MRRQRGCLENAKNYDIAPAIFAQAPVDYRWRSDDEAAPQLRQALRKLAAHLTNIGRIGCDAFAAELRTRMEFHNLTAHIVELGLLQLMSGTRLEIALAELAVSISSPEGRRERDLLVFARAAPAPTTGAEAEHWRGGAHIPSEPVATKFPHTAARATQPRNNGGGNNGGNKPNNNNNNNNNNNANNRQQSQQNNSQRQGAQASKN